MNKALAYLGFPLFLACSCGESDPGATGSGGASSAVTGGVPNVTGGAGGTTAQPSAGGMATGGIATSGSSTPTSTLTGGAAGSGGAQVSAGTGSAVTGGAPNVGGATDTGGMEDTGGMGGSGGMEHVGGTAGTSGTASGGMSSGGALNTGGTTNNATTLKDKYAGLFDIGAAVDSGSYNDHHRGLLLEHFNGITAENEMKFESLQGSEGRFTYATADAMVDFARSNEMKVRGHALVWHSQNPSWLFNNASREVLLSRMENHITDVMGHFQGRVYAWDVVNEAFMNDGSLRDGNEEEGQQSPWYAIIGEDYIAEAFRFAHAADPDAKLFYNDFYNYLPEKQQAIYDMIKGFQEQGVPIDGVGLQCHLNLEPSTDPTNQSYYQNVSNLEDAINLYASLDIEVQITELDLSLYLRGIEYTPDMFYTEATFTDALKAQQAERYREFFEMFRRHSDVITSVTFWGIADDNTWLSEFDSGRKDFPLLFDGNLNPKPAFDAVMDF